MSALLAVVTSSWLLGPVTAVAIVLIALQRREGWIVGLVAQIFWVVYIVDRGEWGLLVSTLSIAASYAYGLYRMVRASREAQLLLGMSSGCLGYPPVPAAPPPPPPPPPPQRDPGR